MVNCPMAFGFHRRNDSLQYKEVIVISKGPIMGLYAPLTTGRAYTKTYKLQKLKSTYPVYAFSARYIFANDCKNYCINLQQG